MLYKISIVSLQVASTKFFDVDMEMYPNTRCKFICNPLK
jgi:hypothetical protein